ncbi:27515_t:CDS:2, partial [Gigaspora margarita]
AVKVRSRVQRTSYKASEKLAVIQEAKKIGVLAASRRFDINHNRRVGAGRVSFYPAAEEELVRWLNELRQMGIAVTAGSIKMQMITILSTTCADKYPGASQQFHASRLKEKWRLWMSNGEFQLTKQGNLKRPSYGLICQWILEAWDDISAEMIIKSFKKCGISNELDGTENDLLYSSDKENSEIDNNEDLLEIVEEDSLSANELELED